MVNRVNNLDFLLKVEPYSDEVQVLLTLETQNSYSQMKWSHAKMPQEEHVFFTMILSVPTKKIV